MVRNTRPASLVIIALGLASILLFSACSDDNGTTEPTPDIWQSVGGATIGDGGGSVGGGDSNDGIDLTIPAGALAGDVDITVSRAAAGEHTLLDPRVQGLGSVYRISGLPAFNDTLHLELTIDPAGLSPTDSVLVYIEEEAYASADGGWKRRGRVITGSVVDRANGVVTASLVGHPVEGVRKSLKNVQISDLHVSMVSYRSYKVTVDNPQFVICWTQEEVSIAWVAELMDALIDAHQFIEDMGLVFENSPDDRIEVHVSDLGTGTDGLFVQSKWGLDSSYIIVNTRDLTGDKIRATAGHELHHFLQMGYGACGRWFGYDYKWLCEALSTWFEAVFLENPDYVPSPQHLNKDFILQGLELETDKHGYGASRFLAHITETHGHTTMNAVLRLVSQQSADTRNGTGALSDALQEQGSSLPEEFTTFAQRYVTATTGHPGWFTPTADVDIMTPDIGASEHTVELDALSLWHLDAGLDWGSGSNPVGTLTITLTGQPDVFVEGFVYTAPDFGGPWTQAGSLDSENTTVDLVAYGQGDRRRAKILLVNQRAIYPYDQTTTAGVNLVFTENNPFVFDHTTFHVGISAVFSDGEVLPEYEVYGSPNHGSLVGNTFTADWDSTFASGTHDTGEMIVNLDATGTRITSWSWWSRRDITSSDSHYYYRASGGPISMLSEHDDFRRFYLQGADVCIHLDDVYYDTSFLGGNFKSLTSWSCIPVSYVNIYLRKSEP